MRYCKIVKCLLAEMSIIKKNIKKSFCLFLGFICLAANAQQMTKTEAGLLTEAIAQKLKKTIGESIMVMDSTISYSKSDVSFSIEIHPYIKAKSGLWQTAIIKNSEVDFAVSTDSKINQQVYEAILSEKLGASTKVTMAIAENGYYYPEVKFKGTIEKCDNDCNIDLDCILIVNGISILFGSGSFNSTGAAESWGEVKHPNNSFTVGKAVDVYCRFAPYMSTIRGNNQYYIKQLD